MTQRPTSPSDPGPGWQPLTSVSVFLSASFPSPGRNLDYFASADPDELTQATLALARATFGAGGRLVFGGHPTISPLVMMAADEFLPPHEGDRAAFLQEHGPLVVVYQSRVFSDEISDAARLMHNLAYGELVWVDYADSERGLIAVPRNSVTYPHSLALMRRTMLSRTDLVGAVFIGGMEGIEYEARMFEQIHPNRPTYFVGAPGGAARPLAEARVPPDAYSQADRSLPLQISLLRDREYPLLMQQIIADIAARL